MLLVITCYMVIYSDFIREENNKDIQFRKDWRSIYMKQRLLNPAL